MTRRQLTKLLSILIIFKTETAFADVNPQEGSFHFTKPDVLQTPSLETLEIERSYSSRSDHTGILGLGWCSELEWRLIKSGPQAWLQKCDDIELLPSQKTTQSSTDEIKIERPTHSLLFSKTGELTGFQKNKKSWMLQKNLAGQPTLLLSPKGGPVVFAYSKNHLLEKIAGLRQDIRLHYQRTLLTEVQAGSKPKEIYDYDDFLNLKTLKQGNRVLTSVGYFDAQDTVAQISENGCLTDFKYESKEDADFVRDRVLETRTCPGRSPQLKENGFRYPKTTDDQRATKKEVKVAIIDTGADINHPELRDSIWRNPGETGLDENGRDRATNGIDDDGNGFIDDAQGWNFAGQDANLVDHHGHGTHIAGIIHKTAPKAKLIIIKYFDPRAPGSANLANLINSVRYAIRMHVDIINFSGGGLSPNSEEKKIFREAEHQGILVVAAAGNESSNSDRKPFYPADYRLSNILSVTAHDQQGALLPSSNYGIKSVMLAAPGLDVVSTLPQGQWGQMTGTSQATAFASGAAALLLEQRPDWEKQPTAIIDHLMTSTRFEPRMSGKTKTEGILDITRSSALQDRNRTFSGRKIQAQGILDSARLPAARRTGNFPLQ